MTSGWSPVSAGPDGDGSLLVLFGVPDHHEAAVIGRNAFPDALKPLFTGVILERPAVVLTDTPEGRARLRGLRAATAGEPGVRFAGWDGRAFVPR